MIAVVDIFESSSSTTNSVTTRTTTSAAILVDVNNAGVPRIKVVLLVRTTTSDSFNRSTIHHRDVLVANPFHLLLLGKQITVVVLQHKTCWWRVGGEMTTKITLENVAPIRTEQEGKA